jgi:hypothetical protein
MPAPKDPAANALWKQRMSEARKGEKNYNYGKHLSDEQKSKISKTRIERGVAVGENNPMYGVSLPSYWKGKHLPEETRRKISEAMIGKPGHAVTEETKEKIHTTLTGKQRSESHRQNLLVANRKPKLESTIEKLRSTKLATTPTGSNSIHWKGGTTPLNLHIRVLPRYKNVCVALMKEVDYTDAFTGVRGGVLACHHIIPQNVIIQMYNIKTIDDARKCPLLFDKHNLIVMLSSAHDKFHNIYGDNKNIYELTQDQIKELYL